MSDYPTIRLLPRHQRRTVAGHPWVYSNEIDMTAEARALPAGGIVRVVTDAGELVGVAGFNPHSLIAARIVDRSPRAIIDADYFASRIAGSLALREMLFDAPHYRLVHAEADGIPGFIADRFGDALCLQFNSAFSEHLREPLLAAFDQVIAPRTVVLRNDSPVRRLEGLETTVEVVRGDARDPVESSEHGVRFLADLAGGQKTGWFFDQRDNRRFMGLLARGGRMLDLFSNTGGFALHAACAGAQDVVAVDRSEPSLALAERSAALNGVDGRCAFVKADAFAEMDRLYLDKQRFDVVVADPPAFIKSKKDIKPGARGYRKMIRLAARLVAPGGFLFVASCSHNMTPDLFDEQLRKGLEEARRSGRMLRRAGAAPDHPVHPWLPETAYLKTVALQLD